MPSRNTANFFERSGGRHTFYRTKPFTMSIPTCSELVFTSLSLQFWRLFISVFPDIRGDLHTTFFGANMPEILAKKCFQGHTLIPGTEMNNSQTNFSTALLNQENTSEREEHTVHVQTQPTGPKAHIKNTRTSLAFKNFSFLCRLLEEATMTRVKFTETGSKLISLTNNVLTAWVYWSEETQYSSYEF